MDLLIGPTQAKHLSKRCYDRAETQMAAKVRQALEKGEAGQVPSKSVETAVSRKAQSISRWQLLLSPGKSLLCRNAG